MIAAGRSSLVSSVHALVLIYDIRGFTRASRRLGTADLGSFAKAAHRVVTDCFGTHPPSFLKNLGDGYLVIWETGDTPSTDLVQEVVGSAIRARKAYETFAREKQAAGLPIPQRIGIGVAFGEVSKHDDYYGVALNLAARLQHMARPEGIAMDDVVYRRFREVGNKATEGFRCHRVRLKGLGRVAAWVKRPFSAARLCFRIASVLALLLVPLGYLAAADGGLAVPGKAGIQDFLDAREWSLLRAVPADARIQSSARELRAQLAQVLRAHRDPQGMVYPKLTENTRGETWASSQALAALLRQPDLAATEARDLVRGLAPCFAEDTYIVVDERAFGWIAHHGNDFTIVEPAMWTTIALALAFQQPDAIPAADTARYSAWLAKAQVATRIHRPLDTGGWNIYPQQHDAALHSTYSSVLALMALLETRSADMPWEGSVTLRDELIHKTAAWLQAQYTDEDELPGWRSSVDQALPISLGLTLQVHAALLRAEAQAHIEIAPRIVQGLVRLYESLDDVSLDQPVNAGEYAVVFTNHEGKETNRSEAINFLWHPWAIELGTWLRQRQDRLDAPRAERVRARRVLAHLVLDLGRRATSEAVKGYTFIASETLFGLTRVR